MSQVARRCKLPDFMSHLGCGCKCRHCTHTDSVFGTTRCILYRHAMHNVCLLGKQHADGMMKEGGKVGLGTETGRTPYLKSAQ